MGLAALIADGQASATEVLEAAIEAGLHVVPERSV
jgi:hypothetical protein